MGVLVEVNSETDFVANTDEFQQLVKDIALHIASPASPQWLTREDVPAQVVDQEEHIARVQAKESGKPDNVIDRIVEGKLRAFFEDSSCWSSRSSRTTRRRSSSSSTRLVPRSERRLRFAGSSDTSWVSPPRTRVSESDAGATAITRGARANVTDKRAGRAEYHRVLLKLSGEAFAPPEGSGISTEATALVGRQLAEVVDLGVADRGRRRWRQHLARASRPPGIERSRADYMGMLATVMNALALQDSLEKLHVPTRVQTAIEMTQLAEPFIPLRARRHLEKGRVVIFAAGLGVPYFSTDTCAAQRALEIGAEALLKGTKVDGVYTADPKVVPGPRAWRRSSTWTSCARATR